MISIFRIIFSNIHKLVQRLSVKFSNTLGFCSGWGGGGGGGEGADVNYPGVNHIEVGTDHLHRGQQCNRIAGSKKVSFNRLSKQLFK